MSDDVRLGYCRLWQSILRRDEHDMREHSRRLGIEKMYPLFICIVTGRSWDAVTQGVDQTAVSKSEVTFTHWLSSLSSSLLSLVGVFKLDDWVVSVSLICSSIVSWKYQSRQVIATVTAVYSDLIHIILCQVSVAINSCWQCRYIVKPLPWTV